MSKYGMMLLCLTGLGVAGDTNQGIAQTSQLRRRGNSAGRGGS